MKKSFVIPLILSLIMGFISAQIVYSYYRKNLEESSYNAYFVQIGSFLPNDFDSKNFPKDKYLVLEENNYYNVYAGITTDLANANRIKKIYDSLDYSTSIRPTVIDNIEFISSLEQYDLLISSVENDDNVISINDVVLSSYEEIVLGNK